RRVYRESGLSAKEPRPVGLGAAAVQDMSVNPRAIARPSLPEVRLRRKPPSFDKRSAAQLFEHYTIEKQLADRLRNASKEERRTLYASVYDELFRRVPHHPQLMHRASNSAVASQLHFVNRFLRPDTTFLEVGAGDCAVSFAVAKRVQRVYAVDVSDEITRTPGVPKNFTLALSDGCSIPVPAGSVDVAFSNQLMEHLHPDDASEQLHNLYRALGPGGIYACMTPNRLTGPHDVSGYFRDIAAGLHLREYSLGELRDLLRDVGFSRVIQNVGKRWLYARFPLPLTLALERTLEALPTPLATSLAATLPLRAVLAIRVVAIKAGGSGRPC
ncbi:MAG: class I SAM-dependent methyltransferase, partial [Steroidobacteraceae bacterium]